MIWVGRSPWETRQLPEPDAVVHVHRAEAVMLLADCLVELDGQPKLAIRGLDAVTCETCLAMLVARYLSEED